MNECHFIGPSTDARFRAVSIEGFEILSRHGGPCRIRNPFGGGRVQVVRNGSVLMESDGDLLVFNTRRNEAFTIREA